MVVIGVVLLPLERHHLVHSGRPPSLCCCVCDIEPKWPTSLRQPICWSPSLPCVVVSSALCCVGWLFRVVVILFRAGRVVVVLIETSPSHSHWFASLGCCVCDIESKWPPSLRHSMGWSLSYWLVVGSSALCCVNCLGRVVGPSTSS